MQYFNYSSYEEKLIMRDDQITLCGNLTAAPILRFTKTSGKAVVNLRVARNYPRNPQTNEQRPTSFFDVEVWEDMAENIAHLPKGARVMVIGRFKSDEWTSEDGTVNRGFRIVADEVGASARWNPVFSGNVRNSTPTESEEGPLDLSEDLF